MAKAIGYFHDDPPQTRGSSAIDQNRAFLDFCRVEGYEVGATFLDTPSGDGSGLRQLVGYLERQPSGTVIVVERLSRLGFDVRHVARAYFQLAALAARVISLDGVETTIDSLLTLWRGRGPEERTGERVRAAMRRKAVTGEVLGRPPFGYCIGPRRRLEPVPAEAAIVRRIFRLYNDEGLGIRLVARRLNEEGARTRRGGNWSMVTIRDILRNRAYLGTYARFGVRVPGSHAAIISSSDYLRAQERLGRRRTSSGPHAPSPFLLSGIVHCAYCGNRMIGISRRQTWQRREGAAQSEYRYYQCETRTNQSMCAYHTRRAGELEEQVRAVVEHLLQHAALDSLDGAAATEAAAVERWQTRLRQLDRRLAQVLDQSVTGRLSPHDAGQQGIDIGRQQLEIERTIARIEERRRIASDPGRRLSERQALIGAVAADAWLAADFSQRLELMHRLLQRVTVHDDRIEAVLWSV